jgi:hypothetical protein
MWLGLLVGEAKVFRHGKAQTLYVSIPSDIAKDSAFTIKEGDLVEVRFDKNQNAVVISHKQAALSRQENAPRSKRRHGGD